MATPVKDNSVALLAMLTAAAAIIAVTALWVFRFDPGVRTVIKRVVPDTIERRLLAPDPPPEPAAAVAPPVEPERPRRPARPQVVVPSPPPPAPVDPPPAVATAASTTTPAAPALPPPDLKIYAMDDRDVVPAELVRGELGTQRLTTSRDQLLQLEIVVDHQGNVESAYVLPSTSDALADAMLSTMALQSIRSWKFRPASLHGAPVKYRQRLWFKGDGQKAANP
jgi:outer membrane biosynthesis protein TonB